MSDREHLVRRITDTATRMGGALLKMTICEKPDEVTASLRTIWRDSETDEVWAVAVVRNYEEDDDLLEDLENLEDLDEDDLDELDKPQLT